MDHAATTETIKFTATAKIVVTTIDIAFIVFG
jgi:hypothetical protein